MARRRQDRVARRAGGYSVGEVAALLALAVYALAYGWRARTLARRGRAVPAWRVGCFTAGLLVLAGTALSPLARLDDERLVLHMLEHVLIGELAALLLVLGLTGPLLAPLLRLAGLKRLRALAHPGVAFAVWAANLWLWHLGVLYEAAVHHELVHGLQHSCFLLAGMALWTPLFGPFPKRDWFGPPAQIVYVLAFWLTGATLGNLLAWSSTALYSSYPRLGDQSAAGAVMLIEEGVLTLALLAWLTWRWIREAGERQELAELAAAAGVAIDERRLARAVTAGRGPELRRRLAAGRP
jgi:putative membrane protein